MEEFTDQLIKAASDNERKILLFNKLKTIDSDDVSQSITDIKENYKSYLESLNLPKKVQKKEQKNIESLLLNTVMIYTMTDLMQKEANKTKEFIDKKTQTQTDYQHILTNTCQLAKELDFNNALKTSILHTYLLWNGYYSKDKHLFFQGSERGLIQGIFSYDIMNSKGVCLNFSSMLTELLNQAGYDAATLINAVDKNTKLDYERRIKRNIGKEKLSFQLLGKILTPISNNIGNHAFNLIKDNNFLYIYDSTNVALLNILNETSAEIVEGQGIYTLNKGFSYMINNEKNINLLDELSLNNLEFAKNTKFSPVLYECLDVLESNKSLLDDYYLSIENNIEKIATVMDNAKVLKKEIRTKKKNKTFYEE
ncbi:MAG: hypothetical protein ACI4OT_03410 [Bacilli bacterium]